jgi:hypothetical protein
MKEDVMFYVLSQEEPTPRVLIDFNQLSSASRIFLIFAILAYTVAMSFIFVKVISRAEEGSTSTILITALALLTFVALTAAILTSSTGLETIAATGVGAIAGAVSHRFIVNEKEVHDDREPIPKVSDPEDQ